MSRARNVFGVRCQINDDVQRITVDMVQGWIKGVNQNFSKASD